MSVIQLAAPDTDTIPFLVLLARARYEKFLVWMNGLSDSEYKQHEFKWVKWYDSDIKKGIPPPADCMFGDEDDARAAHPAGRGGQFLIAHVTKNPIPRFPIMM
jgi:hypothetical protein